MAKTLGFKNKMKLRAEKPSVQVKHIVKETKPTLLTQRTVRIPNETELNLINLKTQMTQKTNKAFVINKLFMKIIEKILKDFENGSINKNYEKYISSAGERYNGLSSKETTRKNIKMPFTTSALLKEQIVIINKKHNTIISFSVLFTDYLDKEIKKLKSKEGL